MAGASLIVFALVAISAIRDPSEGIPANLLQAIFVLLNSLVMLIATMVSTMEIWQISFYSSNAAMDSLTNVHVSVTGNRGPPGGPRSTLQVAMRVTRLQVNLQKTIFPKILQLMPEARKILESHHLLITLPPRNFPANIADSQRLTRTILLNISREDLITGAAVSARDDSRHSKIITG